MPDVSKLIDLGGVVVICVCLIWWFRENTRANREALVKLAEDSQASLTNNTAAMISLRDSLCVTKEDLQEHDERVQNVLPTIEDTHARVVRIEDAVTKRGAK